MPEQGRSPYDTSAGAEAFAKVLAAEQAAEAAVAGARDHAARLLAEARERERAIADRVDVRSQHWQRRTAERARRSVSELDGEAARLGELQVLDARARERIRRVVARLADELTGIN